MKESKPASPRRSRHPMPADVEAALDGAGLVKAYEARPPYQRNDYIGWIDAAKRAETRQRRIHQMLYELDTGDVYMKMAWNPNPGSPDKPPNRSTANSIDEYIAEFPADTQKVLNEMRALIRSSAPEATETISYAIPTYDLNGTHLVHFAGYKNHVGFYPTGRGAAAFAEELKAYKGGKGSVQFPLGTPLPTDLIRRIVKHRVAEVTGTGSR